MPDDGPPLAPIFTVAIMVGLVAIAGCLVMGGVVASEHLREVGGEARISEVTVMVAAWARLFLAATLLLLGLQRRQASAVRGGALVGGALLLASSAITH